MTSKRTRTPGGRRASENGRTTSKRGQIARARTLEGIWETILGKQRRGIGTGPPEPTPLDEAEAKLEEYQEILYAKRIRDYAVDDPFPRVLRRGSDFHYRSFGPPAWFEATYSILHVTVEKPSTQYMTHGGEELLLPLENSAIEYEFYWPRTSEPPWPGGRTTTVASGHCIRINPTLLHRNQRSKTAAGASTAWIILRPLSASPAALVFHSDEGPEPKPRGPQRTFTATELDGWLRKTGSSANEAANFLLVSSGLLEKIRSHRVWGELSEADLSAISGLNRMFAARLERRELRNVSIESLFKLTMQLDIDLVDAVRALRWAFDLRNTSELVSPNGEPVSPFPSPPGSTAHQLHPAMVRLSKGTSWQISFSHSSGEIASLVMLRGKMMAMIEGITEEEAPVVAAGHVFHIRRYEKATLHALEDAEALIVRCGTSCSCGTHSADSAVAGNQR